MQWMKPQHSPLGQMYAYLLPSAWDLTSMFEISGYLTSLTRGRPYTTASPPS